MPISETLWDLPKNQSSQVKGFTSDSNSDLNMRLQQMGFYPGQRVICLRKTPLNGPIVVQLEDCVYSLEQHLAQQILLNKELYSLQAS